MKAPDKIYINKYMFRPGIMRPAQYPADEPEFEYIRKDFLIDKLAHAKALREKSGSKDTEVFDALTNLIQEI